MEHGASVRSPSAGRVARGHTQRGSRVELQDAGNWADTRLEAGVLSQLLLG